MQLTHLTLTHITHSRKDLQDSQVLKQHYKTYKKCVKSVIMAICFHLIIRLVCQLLAKIKITVLVGNRCQITLWFVSSVNMAFSFPKQKFALTVLLVPNLTTIAIRFFHTQSLISRTRMKPYTYATSVNKDTNPLRKDVYFVETSIAPPAQI